MDTRVKPAYDAGESPALSFSIRWLERRSLSQASGDLAARMRRALERLTTPQNEGARERRVSTHPQPRVQNESEHTSIVTTVAPVHPAFPHAVCSGLLRALPGECPRACHRRIRVTLPSVESEHSQSGFRKTTRLGPARRIARKNGCPSRRPMLQRGPSAPGSSPHASPDLNAPSVRGVRRRPGSAPWEFAFSLTLPRHRIPPRVSDDRDTPLE